MGICVHACIPLYPVLPQLNYSPVINYPINLVRWRATFDFMQGAIALLDYILIETDTLYRINAIW